MSEIRILVVDDFGAWRDFVVSSLRKRPGSRIVGQAADGAEALRKAEDLRPDLIVMDIGLPGLNGIEVARRIHSTALGSKILFLTENQSLEIAQEAIRAGAVGYVVKSDAVGDLVRAVEVVLQGNVFLSTRVAGITSSSDEDCIVV